MLPHSRLPGALKAIAALCEELTATKSFYPGTDLTQVYSVKAPR